VPTVINDVCFQLNVRHWTCWNTTVRKSDVTKSKWLFIWEMTLCQLVYFRAKHYFLLGQDLNTSTCQCNYLPLYEQPVGFEQMSRIPCRVIRLIFNHGHFQSPSPAWHYGARLKSNCVLSHRKNIKSCLCWRCAPLIFMSCAEIMVASHCVVNMISEGCATHWTWSVHIWVQNTHTQSCGASTDVQ